MVKRYALNKQQLKRKIILNIFLIVMEIILVINITLSWFVNNKNISDDNNDFFVYHVGLPVYLSAQFNNQEPPDDYLKDSLSITKSVVPGDILNFSVFVELEPQLNPTTILVTAYGIPTWLLLKDNSESLLYATKTEYNNDVVIDPLQDVTCNAVIKNIETIPTGTTYKAVFTIDVPPEYKNYGNGLCLNFSLYFDETYTNQNSLLGQIFTIGFTSSLPSE